MAARTITYRFVVVYVHEGREIPGAPEVWRGQVTDVSSAPPAGEVASRASFNALEELPGILRGMLQTAGARFPVEPAAGKGKD
jgi:hypothetical protein